MIPLDNLNKLPIPGFLDYFISDCGKVISFKSGSAKLIKGRITSFGYGYQQVQLRANNVCQAFLVHRLVYLVFNNLPLNTEGKILHKDGNSFNHHLSNLYLGDYTQNNRDTVRHKHCSPRQARKLTDEQVQIIHHSSEANTVLGIRYGVSNQFISSIKRGKKYRYLTEFDSCEYKP